MWYTQNSCITGQEVRQEKEKQLPLTLRDMEAYLKFMEGKEGQPFNLEALKERADALKKKTPDAKKEGPLGQLRQGVEKSVLAQARAESGMLGGCAPCAEGILPSSLQSLPVAVVFRRPDPQEGKIKTNAV